MRSLGSAVVAIIVAVIAIWLFIKLLGVALKLVAMEKKLTVPPSFTERIDAISVLPPEAQLTTRSHSVPSVALETASITSTP